MKHTEIETPNCEQNPAPCAGRREFLTRSVAGGLAIALGGAVLSRSARADGQTDGPGEKDDDDKNVEAKPVAAGAQLRSGELLIKPTDYPELAKVGGFVTLQTEAGKITVARVSEGKFAAVSAVCTHKGGPILYDTTATQFYCPWHKSRFELDGAVAKGPAKKPLANYGGETAAVLSLGAAPKIAPAAEVK